jgi:hypothetical protein
MAVKTRPTAKLLNKLRQSNGARLTEAVPARPRLHGRLTLGNRPKAQGEANDA